MAKNDNEDAYVELKDRIRQDVIHDNFIPKYSALASAEPKPVVIIGVWLIFAPMFLGAIGFWIVTLFDAGDAVSGWLWTPFFILEAGLAATVLWQQTRRFLRHRHTIEE